MKGKAKWQGNSKTFNRNWCHRIQEKKKNVKKDGMVHRLKCCRKKTEAFIIKPQQQQKLLEAARQVWRTGY